ncbi:MAG TPA: chemotaxis response regulator protein-glutamate methylesterase [Acetivibrio sp.]|uniref:protein-glutamate methylesterase/protein-glutamine glutaminase n=1 Tax=Acetivibrio sp. TaxID=1872092 RepID=UPI002C68B548|nr:chemotaxis response regulator protein-glutamate methylesterase [Acetivibrio sp.]HOM01372.1 chemotaxis response regulator protein-glutamate methylesterase [Acetivibrio sp.]
MRTSIKRKIKVLVVDDSLLFRERISKGIAQDAAIEVVATASNPYEARDKIVEFKPDVMTLDVEMPRMNGIEFLRRLMPQYPIPVVVVSAVSHNVFDALNAGAVDFVTKPDLSTQKGFDFLINELIIKIKIASTAKVGHWKREYDASKDIGSINSRPSNKIIAIGASTGGTEAIFNLLKSFPRDIPGTVIVQHMPPVFTRMYAERLNNTCLMEVREAKHGDRVCPGTVLIAPGDYHMTIKKSGTGYIVECNKGEKVSGHCPSVDVLFNSVAQEAGKNAIGIILTGMGKDGAKGLLAMRQKGARTVGQDEKSCVVYGMPKVAFEMGAVEKQASLESIPQLVYSML